jgi:hypothetical protein
MLVDIVGEVSGCDTRQLRDRYEVHDLLQHYFTPTFNARLTRRRLHRLEPILADGHALVFKTHRPPTAELRARIIDGSAAATFLFRDPRDVVVSAMAEGAKARVRGALPIRNFARLTNFERTMRWLQRRLIPVWQEWTSINSVLPLRYEDLLSDPRGTVAKALAHFDIITPPDLVDRIVRNYAAENVQDATIRRALDLDKDSIEHPEISLTLEQQRRLQLVLEPTLLRMGYLTDK